MGLVGWSGTALLFLCQLMRWGDGRGCRKGLVRV